MANDNDRVSLTAFSTDLGWVACVWKGDTLTALTIGQSDIKSAVDAVNHKVVTEKIITQGVTLLQDVAAMQEQSPLQNDFQVRLRQYAAGRRVDFHQTRLHTEPMTDFERGVLRHCRKIPYGNTLTYGQLAAKAGSPRAARAVGNVMARNRFPIVVPCHRVIGCKSLGGFSAPQGLVLKKQMLKMEGW